MLPLVDGVDPGQALEQCRLAGAVAPDDAEELAAADVERDVVERAQRVVADAAERVQRPFLEGVDALVRKAERLADVLHGVTATVPVPRLAERWRGRHLAAHRSASSAVVGHRGRSRRHRSARCDAQVRCRKPSGWHDVPYSSRSRRTRNSRPRVFGANRAGRAAHRAASPAGAGAPRRRRSRPRPRSSHRSARSVRTGSARPSWCRTRAPSPRSRNSGRPAAPASPRRPSSQGRVCRPRPTRSSSPSQGRRGRVGSAHSPAMTSTEITSGSRAVRR